MVTAVAVRKLNIGAGAEEAPEYETMDISPAHHPDFQHDITQTPWPFDDETFDEVRCAHVLEHIERQHLIAVMNEMWRVVKTGGTADIEVPVFPYWTAIADPTHVSFFVPQTFAYFVSHESYSRAIHGAKVTGDYAEHRQLYGIREWKMRKGFRNEMGSILRVVLEK